MLGHRALYHDGWIASTTPPIAPWLFIPGKESPDPMYDVNWELYNLDKDPTQYDDLAKKNPKKLRQLKDMFTAEATKYNVFPLDNSTIARFAHARPSFAAGRTEFTYSGDPIQIPHGAAPNLLNRSYTITAEVVIPAKGAEGMLVTQGGRFGGYGFYLLKGKPVFVWNLFDRERIRWQGKEPLTPGKHTLTFDFTYNGPGFGKGGLGILSVDGKEIVRKQMKHTIPFTTQWDETFDIAMDTGTPVDDADYQVPFAFTGKIRKITIKLKESPLNEAEIQHFLEKNQRNNQASE